MMIAASHLRAGDKIGGYRINSTNPSMFSRQGYVVVWFDQPLPSGSGPAAPVPPSHRPADIAAEGRGPTTARSWHHDFLVEASR